MKKWYEIIDKDWPDIKITDEVVENTMLAVRRGVRSTVREYFGKIWTDKDYEKRRNEVLNTPLP